MYYYEFDIVADFPLSIANMDLLHLSLSSNMVIGPIFLHLSTENNVFRAHFSEALSDYKLSILNEIIHNHGLLSIESVGRDTSIPVASRGALTIGEDENGFPRVIHVNENRLLRVETTPSSNSIQEVRIRDGNGSALADVETDSQDGKNRLAIIGKVSITESSAPPTATKVSLNNSTPLSISANSDSFYVITDSKTFTVTLVIGGCEGDSSERGSVVEVYYDDIGTLKIIDRLYLNGQTVSIFPDTNQARDGTLLTGNLAGTKRILLRRRRLSGAAQEVDAVLRGYEQ